MTKTLLAAALSIALAPAAWAQDAAPTSHGTSATDLDAVSVIGSGEARQVQRITRENLDILPPGTSLQKTLNLLPGVNAQSADALGTNEQSMTLSLRGFNSTRLGYTLDGVPLGDGAYNNYNGLTINRALISENMAGAELAVGIGSPPATSVAPSRTPPTARPRNSAAAWCRPSAAMPTAAPSCVWTAASTTVSPAISPA